MNNIKIKQNLTLYLPRSETLIYFILWISSVLYAIYRVYLCSQELSGDQDLVPGWGFLNRKQDISDTEWTNLRQIAFDLILYVFIQIILCEFVALLGNRAVIIPYVMVPLVFCLEYFGYAATIFLLIQPLVFYIITIFNSPIVVWFVSAIFLFCINNVTGLAYIYTFINIHPFKFNTIIIITAWMNLKCTSFSLDCVNFYNNIPRKVGDQNSNKAFYNFLWPKDTIENLDNDVLLVYCTKYCLLNLIAYCLFLPTLITGPVILFETFEEGMFNGFGVGSFTARYKTFFKDFLRFTFWFFFVEFSLHYIYSNIMIFHPQWVATLTPWEIYGFGYLMGEFFYMKYLVTYGLAKTFCNLSGIKAPNPPKCIGGIHLYSDMWRYFDEGLYLYLVKYLYKPIIKLQIFQKEFLNSFAASLICFAFIYVWHGVRTYILVWATLNFIGVTIEGISKRIAQQEWYKNFIDQNLSDNWKLRWNAIITSPLLSMSAVSNFYFFAGLSIGNIFAEKLLFGDITYTILTLSFYYCASQTGQYLKNKRNEEFCKLEEEKQD